MKRLIFCADGTWNTPEKRDVTNVVKLVRAIRPKDKDGIPQVVFYDWGVGTGDGLDSVKGGAFGRGIDRNIRDGYRFFIHNYVRGDQIWCFGFSRGAYTVRSLVGLLRNSGLLKKKYSDQIPAAYELYRSPSKPDSQRSRRFREAHSREVKIHFLGVWDTVGALGIPLGLFGRLTEKKYSFHDTRISKIVVNAYHALAIDEKRKSFRPTIWKTKPGRASTDQAWFAGVHSDVGGGYADAGLSDKALEWMVQKASPCGLHVSRAYLRSIRDPDSPERLHNSFTLKWKVLGKYIRPVGTTNRDEAIHTSVLQRWDTRSSYRPKNLREALARDNPPA